MKNHLKYILGVSSIAILTASLPQIASAQTAKEEVVVVTGSRLQGKIEGAVSPVAIIDKEKFIEDAVIDIDDLLKKQNEFAGSIGSTTTPGLSDAQGASTLDMRGMGQNRTLVLVNGTRAAPFGFRNSVDIDTIPTALIKRVETLTGGASAVYGADAVAGVTNFILNDKFEGLEVTTSGGISQRSDNLSSNLGITYGKNFLDDKLNLTGFIGYAERGGVERTDRAWAYPEYIDTGLSTTTTTTGGNFSRSNGTKADGGKVFDLSSFGGSATSSTFAFNGTNNIVSSYTSGVSQYESFVNPNQRYNAAAFVNYQASDKVKFWGRATVSRIKNTGNYTFSNPSGSAAQYGILIRKDNPFITTDLAKVFAKAYNLNYAGTAAGTDAFLLSTTKALADFGGPRTDRNTRLTSQFAWGVKAEVNENLRWDASVVMGHSDEDTLRYGEGSPARLKQAATARLVNGVAQCVDVSGGCVAANIFGTGVMSEEAAAWIMGDPLYYGRNRDQVVASANLYGDTENFFKLPGGAINWSLGYEFRDEKGDMYWDPRILAGDYFGGTKRQNAGAKFNLSEVYAEVRAPLLADLPFIKKFDFEGAFRHSEHSQAGGYDNSKVGINWQIDDNFRIRGSRQTVFRAPNIGELWGVVGGSVYARTTGNVVDYCTNPTLYGASASLCTATGAPAAGYTQDTGGTFTAPFGGDPNMKPETGKTYTAGFVFTPQILPGFSLVADYWNIKLEDAIGGLSAINTVKLCYIVTQDANSTYCQRIKRGTDGQITEVSLVDINVANFETSGVDFTMRYGFKLPEVIPGDRLDLVLDGGWLENFTKQASPLEAVVNCVGKFGVAASCSDSGVGSRPLPEWRGTMSATYSMKPVSVRVSWRYMSAVDNATTTQAVKRIPAYNYYDMAFNWKINEKVRASLSVTNMTDKKPPMLWSAAVDANTIPSSYDIIGRRYGFSLVYKY
jgi:outer membrane receptor protein involved in Fe transport